MNERIKELAKQASKEAFPLGSMAWMEKFAELIIQQCATIVDSAFDIDEHSGEVVSYADGTQLKEHFGIES